MKIRSKIRGKNGGSSGLKNNGTMLGKSSSGSFLGDGNVEYIGTAISNGQGLYANEIQNARDTLERDFGAFVKDAKLAVADLDDGVMGMSDGTTVYLGRQYASNTNMTKAMKEGVKSGFHPSIGDKSGTFAVSAHELGHHIAGKIERTTGVSQEEMVARAGKRLGIRKESVASNISEYARYNYHETIAESFADVYCNGSKANKASIAVVNEVKSLLK